MISRERYLKLREMTRRYEAARKRFDAKRYERGGGYDVRDRTIISAMAGSRDSSNDEKSQIEEYEWRMFPPSRYFAYYDSAMTKITGFMGNVLGRIVFRGSVTKKWGGKRQNITVRGTNNVMYAGVCNLTGGTYCRLKRIKGRGPSTLPNAKKRKRPAAKKKQKYTYQQILDYYARYAGRSRRNPTVEHHHGAYIIRGRGHGKEGTLVQTDWDYPSVAQDLGWSLRRVQKDRRGVVRHLSRSTRVGCEHGPTDGTITCRDCGVTATDFIGAAAEYLDSIAT